MSEIAKELQLKQNRLSHDVGVMQKTLLCTTYSVAATFRSHWIAVECL